VAIPEHSPLARHQAREFRTTHWSVVLLAGQASSPESTAALDELCRVYWFPLYAFVRREGHGPEAAQDLTQAFFCHLLGNCALASVHPAKGRFRSFLLASFKNFLANEWDRTQAIKRGGGQTIFSLDEFAPEQRHRVEPVDIASPDKLFDRRWAETLLSQAMIVLRRDYVAAGWESRFEALKVYLLNEHNPSSYAETALALGLSEGAVKSAIYKLRQRFAVTLRQNVAQTVADPADVEGELRELLTALRG
jgi:RNA polymerase sigma-70 factor (ECF subfamily)